MISAEQLKIKLIIIRMKVINILRTITVTSITV